MINRYLRRLGLAALLFHAGSGAAAIAMLSLNELTQLSRSIRVIEVSKVTAPKWTEESGSNVVLAYAKVIDNLKGRANSNVVVALSERMSDQPKIMEGERLVIFGFGPDEALLFGHQVRALNVQRDEVVTGALVDEPKKQPLKVFVDRVRAIISR